jgi:hypothetical protein
LIEYRRVLSFLARHDATTGPEDIRKLFTQAVLAMENELQRRARQ